MKLIHVIVGFKSNLKQGKFLIISQVFPIVTLSIIYKIGSNFIHFLFAVMLVLLLSCFFEVSFSNLL